LSPAFRYLYFTLGLLIAVPFLFILYLSIGLPVSQAGIVYLAAYSLLVLGLICAPWLHRWGLIMSLTGVTILLVTIALRIFFPPSGSQMNIITLPGPSSSRILTRVFDEQDIVLFGAKVAPSVGFVSSLEYSDLIPSLSQTYKEMRTQGVTPLSPTLTTYLGQQHPDGFDALLAQPSSEISETGIIFLHGFGGNFTLECWLIAEAGNRLGAITLCPSTDPSGQWWKEEGTAILQASLNDMRQRGVKRIYLAGLSNGGIGASRLAERFKNDLAGLILISGADPNTTITDLPVLIIHGKDDERIPAAIAEQYAAWSVPSSTYRLFDSDHFVLLKDADQVQEAIVDWLTQQENR
jgi:pimeloyl-ACP methyl ester carboxylesterase